jgi:spermidine synthase
MTISLLAIGLVSILGQVVLLRELNVSFYGVELIYILSMGIWLFWTAIGAVIGRRVHFPSLNNIAILFIIFGIALPLDIVFIRSSRLIFGGLPGAYLTFFQQLIVVVISVLPAGLLSGLLFQWTAKAFVTTGRTLAVAYAIESAGGLIGGLFSTLLIMWGLQNCSIAFICAFASIITPVIVLRGLRTSPLRWTAIVLACIFLALLWRASYLDRQMTIWNHPNLLESSDSPYGRITTTRLYNQISVFENDALSFETEGTEAEYFCHLAALQHSNPQDVLILGGGIEGLVGEIAKYAPRRIDYIELNPVMLNMVIRYLPGDIRKPLGEPNVHIIFSDPRQYLKKSGTYDLILVGMPEPSSGQANRFFTREFFQQCSVKLNPGGILGFRLRTAENLWTKSLTSRNSSIYNALQSVFPEALFLPGTTNVVTASFAPLPRTPEVMYRRLQDRKIATRLISPNYIKYLFTNDRFFKIKELLKSEKAQPNTDIRPVCYQYAFLIWLSKFFPRIAAIDPSSIMDKVFFKPPLSLLLWISLPIIFLLSRFQPKLRRVMLVASAGFMGMVLETILILYYQVKHGVLYQDIGLLLMSFMAGLAVGAIVINSKMHRQVDNQILTRWHGISLLIGFCFLCASVGMSITMNISAGLFQISCLLAVTGFLVAGIFAYASLHESGASYGRSRRLPYNNETQVSETKCTEACRSNYPAKQGITRPPASLEDSKSRGIEDQKKVISPLYSADLIGGCLGSLVGILILIPMAGMDVTTWGMLLLAAFSILLV